MLSFTTIVKKLKPSTIRGQLILGITLVHLLLMTIFVYDLVAKQKTLLRKQNRERATVFVNEYAINTTPFIIANDFDQLQRFTLYNTNFSDLRYAMILSADGIVMSHTNNSYLGKKPTDNVSQQLTGLTSTKILLEDDDVLDIAAPIVVDKKIIGWARVGIGQDYIRNNLTTIIRNGVLYIIIALLTGSLFAILIGNQLTAELYKLIATTKKIKNGDRATRVYPPKTTELLHLGTAVNQMLDEISSNEELLSTVIENMPVGIWILNEKKEIVLVNSAAKQIWEYKTYGKEEHSEQYKGWYPVTKQLIEPHQWASARAIEKGEMTINEEIEIETFIGNRKTISNSAIPLKAKDGINNGAIVIDVDITERKKITEQLKVNESILSNAFNYSAIGMGIVLPDGTFLRVNTALCKMLGYTEEEILPLTFKNFTHPDDLEENMTYFHEVLEGKVNSFQMEKRYFHKNGAIVWVHISSSLVRDSQNKPMFFITQIEDITERKRTTEQLTLNESILRMAFDNSTIAMGLVSLEGKFFRVNREVCNMFGYTEEELFSLSFKDTTHPDDLEKDIDYAKRTIEGEFDSYQVEKRYFHKNGQIIWANLYVSLVRDNQNNPLFFVSQIADITERKKTTEQLTLNESILRSAFDRSAIGMALVLTDGKFLRVNRQLCRIVGYTEQELLSLTFQEITLPEDLNEDLVYLNQTLEGKRDTYEMEKRYFHKNGSVIWVHLSVSLVRDSENKPLFFVSQIEDINERKKTEALIKESEEKFRKLVEETLVGVFILQNGKFLYVNPQVEKIMAYSKEELLGGMSFGELIHKDDLQNKWKNYLSGVAPGDASGHYLLKAVNRNGVQLQVEVILSPITLENKPAVIGTIIDITERVEEEKRINKAVTDAQENERQQISMELHDNVKQLMGACLLNFDFLKLIVQDEKAQPIIGNINMYIRQAIEEIRRISHQLAPIIDASVPIKEKIRTVVETMNVSKDLKISYHFDESEEEIKTDVQLALYRIVQEQFTNILQHSNASLVDITVQRRNGDICMSIEDNGVGFDTHKTKTGIGLENIRRRVQVLNGNFSIQTLPGDGCTLYVELPVN